MPTSEPRLTDNVCFSRVIAIPVWTYCKERGREGGRE